MFVSTRLVFKWLDQIIVNLILIWYLRSPIILWYHFGCLLQYCRCIYGLLQQRNWCCKFSYHVDCYVDWTDTHRWILFYTFYLVIRLWVFFSRCHNSQSLLFIGYFWPKNYFFNLLEISWTDRIFYLTQIILLFHSIHLKYSIHNFRTQLQWL